MNLEPTTSFGKLFIDERNGYIGLGTSARYNSNKCEWYHVSEITNPGLYCTKPRCDYRHRVMVDCEFVCDIPSRGIHIKRIVKQRIFCQHHPYTKNPNYEEWSEPGAISIVRGVMVQTFSNAFQREFKVWEDKLCFLDVCVKEQARCAFLLNPEYTRQDVETQYQRLKSAFQDDMHSMMLIERYYKELLEDDE